jgi:hypothetical protein
MDGALKALRVFVGFFSRSFSVKMASTYVLKET